MKTGGALKIVLLPQAQEDLDLIQDPLLTKVVKRLHALKIYPSVGAPMAGPYAGYRSTPVGPFRIIYKQASPDRIFVAYLRHCRRQWPPESARA